MSFYITMAFILDALILRPRKVEIASFQGLFLVKDSDVCLIIQPF